MSFFKKLMLIKNELGFALVGLIFTVIGGFILSSGTDEDLGFPIAITAIGVLCFVIALIKAVKLLKTPSKELKQYDRVDPTAAAPTSFAQTADPNEPQEDFVFHFTGKANQSYVMEDQIGAAVYEAVTEKILALKPRPFVFHNFMTGEEDTRMIGAPVTYSLGSESSLGMNISSTFKVDGQDIWELIASMGYGFSFSMNGLAPHFEVRRWNQPAGSAEMGGTGLVNPKYKDNPLGKIPTNGIFKVRCRKSDVPGFFLICFALAHTDLTLE